MKRSHCSPGPKKSCHHEARWVALPVFMVLIGPRSAGAYMSLWESPRLLEDQHRPGPIRGSARIAARNRPAAVFISANSGAGRIRSGGGGPKPAQTGGKYIATVSKHTKEPGNQVGRTAADTGCGIPENIGNRIFQPLFTPVLAGVGTDLGLCPRYHIIVKVHGRKLPNDTITGEKFRFLFILPQQSE
jgi:hypothetical protein